MTNATHHLDTALDGEVIKGFLMPSAGTANAAVVPGLGPGYLALTPFTASLFCAWLPPSC